ncbi:hypothetical protein ANCCEY_08179 [Ancylostoma ceylanicum]|uniref:Replication factor C C-terminal domain-containing protein n=1 Tax=Ancylostoma ceylanicum TaxID=53326 RepID=A0A0D6LND8_9BILA|nr:hypothetical protein ANCCEY_08179 [Ancylostoma ceylanicum]
MEADQLTRDAQHALRRTMEKYTMSCRLILCSESLSRIIEPLRSRCMVVRVAAPTDEEIKDVCLSVAEKVRLTVPDPVLEQIVTKSRGNLRRALLSMEAVKRKGVPIKDNEQVSGACIDAWFLPLTPVQVPEPEWEIYLRETADMMIKKQSNETVLAYLLRYLIKRCPPSAILETVEMAALYEHRLTRGQKAIIHLEAFVVAFMDIYLSAVSSKAMEK